ncbi:MAG: hypothetical protein HON78_03465 [Legionellales bacterium]|nr:hypothetical protein [Legionellales bacterium]
MLDFNIIPFLISSIKYGGVIIGLDLTKAMSDPSKMMTNQTEMIAKVWGGFKSISPNNLATITCSFLFLNASSILLMLKCLVFPVALLSSLYVLLCLVYLSCLFYLSKFEPKFEFKSDRSGLIMMKTGLYLIEFCLASILLACAISAVGSIMLAATSFSPTLIANIAYISVFGAAMLANYCTTPENPDDAEPLLFKIMPAAKEWSKSFSYKVFASENIDSNSKEDEAEEESELRL